MRAFGLALLFFALLFGALALMPEKEKLPTVEELDSQVDDVWYGVYFDARKLGWSHHTFAKGGTAEAPTYLRRFAWRTETVSVGEALVTEAQG